ncbi:sulfurtransferase-like selenium metabolism protein YedF [Clostridium paraputrificum]|uniref:sulfurtransferase-like selenium metabolism protein YedF n=1 Tax=Clostridium TaxID=1485 RepID=UPI003D349D16
MKRIDCKGLQCPVPVKRIKKYFDSIGEGEAIVFVDNDIANGNVVKYAMSQGYQVESKEINGGYEIKVEKRGCLEVLEEEKEISILITTDKLGEGDDKLGENLMISYFDTLSEEDKVPKTIVFLNGGVRLATRGSKIIEGLKLLQEKGVNIFTSKTCLESYGLEKELLVGKVTDMSEIVEIMNSADDLIKL